MLDNISLFTDPYESAPPRYEEVIKAVPGAPSSQPPATAPPATAPSTLGVNPNSPSSILRSSSPPAYWTQIHTGGHGGGGGGVGGGVSGRGGTDTDPSAPNWGSHLPSIQQGHLYPTPGIYVSVYVTQDVCTIIPQ